MKTTEQLQELLRVAERAGEATNGNPWRCGGRCGPNPCSAFQPDHTLSAGASVIAYVENSRDNSEAVFVHCATFDPATCAELVRELIRARERLDRLRVSESAKNWGDAMFERTKEQP